jgi:hypothetical protein
MSAINAAYEAAAQAIGCDLPAIRAVFDVEASGRFLDEGSGPVHRFEPHHFPREHWGRLNFNPTGQAPWKASLALSTPRRRAMYDAAYAIDAEAAAKASSWGAPQIMGFNHAAAGYRNATSMRTAFADPVKQIEAFAALIIDWGLDGAVRAHDWLAFATRYNGSGQAAEYARRMESAYRKRSGQASAVILRRGATGKSVEALQERLASAGYLTSDHIDGAFGPATEIAVKVFQTDKGLAADGVVGARTWAALPEAAGAPEPEKQETKGSHNIAEIVKLASGAAAAAAPLVPAASGNGPFAYALAAVLVIGAIAGAFYILRRRA